jgi:hypothetical protein
VCRVVARATPSVQPPMAARWATPSTQSMARPCNIHVHMVQIQLHFLPTQPYDDALKKSSLEMLGFFFFFVHLFWFPEADEIFEGKENTYHNVGVVKYQKTRLLLILF